MAEKKEGFLKRIFRFGKKTRDEEEEVDTSAADAAAEAEAVAAEEAAQKLAEDEARVAAELAAAEAEIARRKAEEEEAAKAVEAEAKRRASEKAEAERLAAEEVERLEAERLAAEEEARLKAEQAAAEEAAARAEQGRIAAEEAAEKAAAEAEAERVRLEQERLAAEKAAEEEAERLRLAQEAAADEAERERLAKEAEELKAKAEAERAEREAAVDKARREAEAAETERLAQEQAATEAAEAERLAAEQKADEEAEAVRLENERLEAERVKDETEEVARQKAEAAEKIAAEEAAQREREEAEKRERERLEAEQAEVPTQVADAEPDGVFSAPPETHTDHAEPTPEPLADTPEPALVPASEPVEPEPEQPEKKKSWFSRLKDGLAKSSSSLTENITAVFTKKKLDEDSLQELEDILIQADLGVETAMNVTDKLASQRMGKDVTDEEVRELMASEIETVLEPVAAELELDLDHTPHVILVVGVNGSGKTTTIGKLSQKLYDAGFSTLLVAGDTFRAAAIEQLQIWGERTQSPVVSRPLGSDSAGLAFDAFDQCVSEGRDVMLMDTAGRLQNKKELMDELEKIIRVLKKQDPTAPHTVLLTLDATTGQNAMNQVDIFRDVAGVNGLVMTKLDGTARGGILVAISAKHKLPVYFLGVGETVDDLEPFEARDFARSIAGLEV